MNESEVDPKLFIKQPKKIDYGPLGASLVVMVIFGAIGYFCGGLLGAFMGACFAYMTWWLKEIHDMLYEKKHPKQDKA